MDPPPPSSSVAPEPSLPPQPSPRRRKAAKPLTASIFTPRAPNGLAAPSSSTGILSSSPAFGTPLHPLKPFSVTLATKTAILPILLPVATLRPLAFRTCTKKHGLTVSSSALQELATFIGRHCGSGWREDGLADRVLEEVSRAWKARGGGVMVDAKAPEFAEILKALEGNMVGGRIVEGGGANSAKIGVRQGFNGPPAGLARQNSLLLETTQETDVFNTRLGLRPSGNLIREDSNASFGMSALEVEEEGNDDEGLNDPRRWLKVIDAFSQPRYIYNVDKRHFEKETSKPSVLPVAAHKTTLFRNRFNAIHQRLLRNESFQSSAVLDARASSLARSASGLEQQTHKITPIANLLGRHGTHHMLLGMLNVLPTGTLAISDLTATISLDLAQAAAIPEDSAWFTPGMIVLIDGVYEEEEESVGRGLAGSSGVGGNIGGKFRGFFVGQPPCEKRRATFGVSGLDGGPDHTVGGGFGWIDFLGVGSERAVGSKMRKLETRLMHRSAASDHDTPGRGRIIILGELNLDQPRTLQALRKVLSLYAAEPEGSTPLSFILAGNFAQHAVMARGGSGGSIEYKEYFDGLASTLSDFPTLLQASTFVFVPGDNDGWASSFSAGGAVPLPRKGVPDMFTSRIRRAFATANAELDRAAGEEEQGSRTPGEAVWTSNPSRLSLFGPNHEIVVFRDDISARLRRAAVRLKGPKSQEANGDGANGTIAGQADDTAMSRANAGMSASTETHDELEAMEVDAQPAESDGAQTKTPDSEKLSTDTKTARKLVKTLLDQGYLAPFRQAIRPVHWDFGSAMHLYPLPTALVLVDTTAPAFCITYEGCHVMNPGGLLVTGRRGVARWIEYEVGKLGKLRECLC